MLSRTWAKNALMIFGLFFLLFYILEIDAFARAGGGRSSGSRGSRSYSSPASPSPQQSQSRQQYVPTPNPIQQQTGGGFMRGIAGGIMGSMLFSSIAGAGAATGAATGSGIGLFEIILLAGVGYLIYRYIKRKRAAGSSAP